MKIPTPTLFDIHRDYKSNLDLVLTSNLASYITTVLVSDETWDSDHCPIFVYVNAVKHTYVKKTFKIKSTRTDWDKFHSNLDTNYEKFLPASYDILSPRKKYNFL